jgi:hypothetical protein
LGARWELAGGRGEGWGRWEADQMGARRRERRRLGPQEEAADAGGCYSVLRV